MTGLPDALTSSLVDGPSLVTEVRWFDECPSTNTIAATAAASGAAEGLLVVTDFQTAGRGRHGRTWVAPPGTSLMFSLLLRPGVDVARLPLLPLLGGMVLADTVARHLPDADVAVKWPNDLLVDERKAAGLLAESTGAAAVLGVGVNVDWRGVDKPPELGDATSLAEAAGHDVDRWRLLAGFLGVFSNAYGSWRADPAGFLPAYRERSATLGRRVLVHPFAGDPLEGEALGIDDSGALRLRTDAGAGAEQLIAAGDVEHIRPA